MNLQELNKIRPQKTLVCKAILEEAVGRELTETETDVYKRAFLDCFEWIMNEQIKELEAIISTSNE